MATATDGRCELFQCREHEIDAAWKDGAHRLSEAVKWAARDVTTDQLKMLLSRSERILIGARCGNEVLGWAAVQVLRHPNLRVLHIYAMQGRGIASPEVVRLIKQYAKDNGCSSIRGSVRPSMVRLLRKIGCRPIYTTVEMEIT